MPSAIIEILSEVRVATCPTPLEGKRGREGGIYQGETIASLAERNLLIIIFQTPVSCPLSLAFSS
jgi:hypothetical protein